MHTNGGFVSCNCSALSTTCKVRKLHLNATEWTTDRPREPWTDVPKSNCDRLAERGDLGLGTRTGDRQQKGRKQPPHTHTQRERHAQTHEGMQTHAHREMCILMMCYLNPLLNCSSTYVFVLLHFSSFRLWLLCC